MHRILIIGLLCTSLLACGSDKEVEEEPELVEKKKEPIKKSNSQANTPLVLASDSLKGQEEEEDSLKKDTELKSQKEKLSKTLKTASPLRLRPQELLLRSLDAKLKIEFAQPDYQIFQEDTTIQLENAIFKIDYATSCLNDSLIAQEMFDYGGSNAKSYLISHNYKTNIRILKDGLDMGKRTIEKDLFRGQLEPEFLDKSILKHPQFVRFDKEKNEAVFQFIVGIPNTDWLVVAGINLSQEGQVRVIDISSPDEF